MWPAGINLLSAQVLVNHLVSNAENLNDGKYKTEKCAAEKPPNEGRLVPDQPRWSGGHSGATLRP